MGGTEAENNKAASKFKRALLKYFECEESHGIEKVEVVPIVINWRGVMSERTYRALTGTVGMTPSFVKYVQLKGGERQTRQGCLNSPPIIAPQVYLTAVYPKRFSE
ncbi:Uncharacterized protein FKW44_014872 [Caligus rogercresseyi]|uniref:Uncharacterized protein n=1 Tax=Caligus rogercresseyi TaxID=217165 RepID=A0A7T8H0C8_CALRO|nr:Uncharacterized protein FKW44_014872 [Caligus rogercresseyi]